MAAVKLAPEKQKNKIPAMQSRARQSAPGARRTLAQASNTPVHVQLQNHELSKLQRQLLQGAAWASSEPTPQASAAKQKAGATDGASGDKLEAYHVGCLVAPRADPMPTSAQPLSGPSTSMATTDIVAQAQARAAAAERMAAARSQELAELSSQLAAAQLAAEAERARAAAAFIDSAAAKRSEEAVVAVAARRSAFAAAFAHFEQPRLPSSGGSCSSSAGNLPSPPLANLYTSES